MKCFPPDFYFIFFNLLSHWREEPFSCGLSEATVLGAFSFLFLPQSSRIVSLEDLVIHEDFGFFFFFFLSLSFHVLFFFFFFSANIVNVMQTVLIITARGMNHSVRSVKMSRDIGVEGFFVGSFM